MKSEIYKTYANSLISDIKSKKFIKKIIHQAYSVYYYKNYINIFLNEINNKEDFNEIYEYVKEFKNKKITIIRQIKNKKTTEELTFEENDEKNIEIFKNSIDYMTKNIKIIKIEK